MHGIIVDGKYSCRTSRETLLLVLRTFRIGTYCFIVEFVELFVLWDTLSATCSAAVRKLPILGTCLIWAYPSSLEVHPSVSLCLSLSLSLSLSPSLSHWYYQKKKILTTMPLEIDFLQCTMNLVFPLSATVMQHWS